MSLENPHPDYGLAIDLARERDFRLGPLTVIPSAREVIRNGSRESLEPRVMQVLVALVRAEGAVVSRDEMILRCWDGRVVGEDSINRVIWRLRKLAEGDDPAPFVIETIPRIGYRLKPAQAEVPPPKLPQAPGTGRVAILYRVGHWLLAAIGIGLVAWAFWPDRHRTMDGSRAVLSTFAQEGEPAFSPDGRKLAYLSGPDGHERQLYVRNLADGRSIRITRDTDDKTSPSWSPDGTRLAYVAERNGEPCRIMVVTVPSGSPRQAGRCRNAPASALAWQPGTPFLYFTDRTDAAGNGIFRLDLDTGRVEPVVAPEGGAPNP